MPVCTGLIDQVSADCGRRLQLDLFGVAAKPGGGEKIICGATLDGKTPVGWDIDASGRVTQNQGPPLPGPSQVPIG